MSFSTQQEGREKKSFNEINITPLTDIFLVLLIIMMVIAPSFQSMNNNIDMPQISSGNGIELKNATVSITKDGSFYLNEEQIDPMNLEQKLSSIAQSLEKKEVIVKADKQTRSSEIMKVMKAAQDSGFEKMVVAGEPLNNQEQKELKEKSKKGARG